MMERLALEQFKAWKDKGKRKPLLVTGVRQCGKTYLIRNFGETEFEEMAYFNFDGNAGLQSVFDYDFNTKRIIDELDEALNFVLRNIRLGAEVKGLLRSESYELPIEAIREMIVNAYCHRNMTDESCVQVAIYDDRLEVTSPGGLYNGLTFEDMMHGHSKLRNRAIANVFSQMRLVESWGTGIKKIIDSVKEYGLQEPEFIEMPETFCVNLFRKALPTRSDGDVGENDGESSVKFGESSAKNSVKFGEIR